MALDLSLASRIRARLKDDDEEVKADEFTILSETTGNPIQDSINRVIQRNASVKPNQSIQPTAVRQSIFPIEREEVISQAPEETFTKRTFDKFKAALPDPVRQGLFGTGQVFEREGEVVADKGLFGFIYGGLTESDSERFEELREKILRKEPEITPERAAEVAFDTVAGNEIELSEAEQKIVTGKARGDVGEKLLDLLDFIPFLGTAVGVTGDVTKKIIKTIAKTDNADDIAKRLVDDFKMPDAQARPLADELAAITDEAAVARRIDEVVRPDGVAKTADVPDKKSDFGKFVDVDLTKRIDEPFLSRFTDDFLKKTSQFEQASTKTVSKVDDFKMPDAQVRKVDDVAQDVSFKTESDIKDFLLETKKLSLEERFGVLKKKHAGDTSLPFGEEEKALSQFKLLLKEEKELFHKTTGTSGLTMDGANAWRKNVEKIYGKDTAKDLLIFTDQSVLRFLNKRGLLDDIKLSPDNLIDEVGTKKSISDRLGKPVTTTEKTVSAQKPVRQAPLKKRVAPTAAQKKELQSIDNSPVLKSPSDKPKATKASQTEYVDQRDKIARLRDSMLEHTQDQMVETRRLVESGQLKITDLSNPYEAEIAFHGRVGSRVEDLKVRVDNIDADIVKTSKNTNQSPEQMTKEVNEFLIARHAPERNAQLGKELAAGISTPDAVKRVKEINALPHAADIKRIADDIQAMNDETLDILRDGEVITDDLYDLLRKKYKKHIPLQRIMESEEDFAGAMARGFDVKGSGVKTAKGSEREVSDVLGNVAFNYEQALIRAEKNRVDLSVLKMVRDNKEVLRNMFKVRRPKVVGKTFSGRPISEMVTDPQILVMKEKGHTVLIEIKDPHLAVALRGVGRQKFSGMMRGISEITRLYSGVHTRFNPEFAFSNKVRDIQEVLVFSAAQGELGIKGAAKIAAREAKLQNATAVTDFLRGKDSEGARMYKQMRADGGTTGGLGLSTRAQIELDVEKLRKLNRSKPHRAAQKTIEYIDKWNQIFEDSSRLSVYRQALEGGATRQRAAVLAKESSVNFNKFGKQGSIINSLWIFSNASIQGTTKMIRAMKDPKVAAVVSTAVMSSVYAVAEWNDTVDPDWRNKIREWDRMNSLAIMLPNTGAEVEDDKRGIVRAQGGVRYLTIPVSWGIKPIKVMADEMLDLASGAGSGVAAAAASVLSASINAYNPVGGTDVIAGITPTVLDIPVDVARNQAWHGGAIKPDWDRNAPASIQYFDSLRDSTTGRAAIGISKGLSGIGIEVSPASMHYGYEQVIGGAGRFVSKTVNTLTAIGSGEVPEPRDVPVVSRFYKSIPEEQAGAGASEFEMIAKVLEEQSRDRFYLSQEAEDSYQQLRELPQEEAAALFEDIKEANPDLAKKITSIKNDDDKGLSFIDRKILQLGVGNGERAKFLQVKFADLETNEEKAQLWTEYREKGIISDSVSEQLKKLLNEDD